MRRISIPIFACLILLAVGCKKSDTEVTSCQLSNNFSLIQQGSNLKLSITSSANPAYYELFIEFASSSGGPGSGTPFIVNGTGATLSIDSLGLTSNQVYNYYLRASCSSTDHSAWSASKTLTITNFCDRPKNLGFSAYPDGMGFDWQVKSGSGATAYQVQYGPAGFSLGSGITASVSNSPYTGASMTSGSSYDFYVRSSCSGSLGNSEWSGPYTYLATGNQNLCLAPLNATYTIVRNGLNQPIGANFQWNRNGESSFEYTIVPASQPVTSGTINTIGSTGWPTIVGLFQDTDYHFYVRGVCLNGGRTSWLGPLAFNIGH